MPVPLPPNESARLRTLLRYTILDTPPEVAFDRITSLAARLFNVPVALVSLVDAHREWFKSVYGLNVGAVPRDVSFGAHVVLTEEVMVVPDASADPRFADNTLVTGRPAMRYYAGAPLKTADGLCLGALCILDDAPREPLDDAELRTLEDLATIVVDEIELRSLTATPGHLSVAGEDIDAALRDTLAPPQAILDHAPALIHLKDTQGRYLLINRQFERVMRVTREQVVGKTDYDIFPDHIAMASLANDHNVLEAGRPLEFEELVRHDDGMHTYSEIRFPLYNQTGTAYAVGGIATDITDRRRVEEALRESEEQFLQLTETLDDCVWISSMDTLQLVYLSPAYETIWGRSRHEVEEDPELWRAVIHPDDREELIRMWDAQTRTPREFNAEYRIVRPDGEIRWIWDRAFPIHNVAGEIYRFAGIATDVSAQKHAESEIRRLNAHLEQRVAERTAQLEAANRELVNEVAERARMAEALRASEERWRIVSELTSDYSYAYLLQPDDTIIHQWATDAFSRITGYAPEEMDLRGWGHFYHHEDRHLFAERRMDVRAGRPTRTEFRICTKNGEVRWLRDSMRPLGDVAPGDAILVYGAAQDITERKRAEEAVRVSERKYRLLMEQAADGIFVVDRDGNYIEVNPEGCRMLGYTREEILALNMRDLLTVEDMVRTPIPWAELHGGAPIVTERRLLRKDRTLLPVEINAKRLDNGDLQAIVRDITARKQAEARLQESERRLAEAQRLAHLGAWEWNIPTNRVTGSDEFYRIFGLEPATFEATAQAFLHLVHPDDRAVVNQTVQRALHDQQPFDKELRIVRPDGETRFVRSQAEGELDAQEQPLRMVGTAQDVTVQKEAEIRAQREAARTKVLLRVAARLNAEVEVKAVLNAVCEETVQILDVPIVYVALQEPQDGVAVYAAGLGIPPADAQRLLSVASAHYGAYHWQEDYVIVPDLSVVDGEANDEESNALSIHTMVLMNILRQGAPTGALIIATRHAVRDFTDDELALLRGLADQAGQAIATAQLLEQARMSRERLRRLTGQVVVAQEEERRRLSRELHDEAGQALTGLEISLKLMQTDLPSSAPGLHQRLTEAIALTGATMDQIRLLAQDLRPPALDAVGLNLTLEGYCLSFAARTGLSITYTGMETPALPDTSTIALYRVLQEALTNIAKHAQAQRVRVALQATVETTVLSVVDDGRGFDKQAALDSSRGVGGIGLIGMQERLDLLGGRLELDSEPGHGTRLVAYVPLD